MSTSGLFYCGIEVNDCINYFIEGLRAYSDESNKPIYIIDKALGKNTKIEDYEYRKKFVVLAPQEKILIINYGGDKTDFDFFVDDFISDLEYLSKRYGYQKKIGRSRSWEDCISKLSFDEIKGRPITELMKENDVPLPKARIVELLISLLIGSINDIEKIDVDDPETLLDKIKQKIVLFDGMQSRFLYKDIDKDVIRIQGLAGTGKTELLLHKLSEIYIENKNSKMAFTCYNKVLARKMQTRIPMFFNFMRIEEQIDWDTRLLVCSSWGLKANPNSGLYSFICNKYNLEYQSYAYNKTFDDACNKAIAELKEKAYEKYFDYIFIDESQDFAPSFFELCKMVTKKRIYIAGDVFQNVFDTHIKSANNIDYLLNKCYRTEPKTLMLAQSIGMGLYEKPVIRWLEDDEWQICGYTIDRENGRVAMKRTPLRRFEDIEAKGIRSLCMIKTAMNSVLDKVIGSIDDIIAHNPTVNPDDIAVVFLENNKVNYDIIDRLFFEIQRKYKWNSTKGFVVKETEKDHVFISNLNNIKGLEFPFVICVETGRITYDIRKRNSIYMVLTRSFLSSYFVVVEDKNEAFVKIYEQAIEDVMAKGYMDLVEPSEEEKKAQSEKIRLLTQRKYKSLEEMIDEVCDRHPNLSKDDRKHLQMLIPNKVHNLNEDEVKLKTEKIIEAMLA